MSKIKSLQWVVLLYVAAFLLAGLQSKAQTPNEPSTSPVVEEETTTAPSAPAGEAASPAEMTPSTPPELPSESKDSLSAPKETSVAPKKPAPVVSQPKKRITKIYANVKTNHGDIKIRLFHKFAPLTVKNFIQLATGKKEWLDIKAKTKVKRPFYDGLIFHRVIPGFMIQGGCPNGDGTGGPGFTFKDEFSPSLSHYKAGIVSMANRGANTNGSQFFITLAPHTSLDRKYNIFGEVIEGLDVVKKIGSLPRARDDRPREDVIMETVTITYE